MTNETVKTLEILAQKLGTTSEYLWNILLKQATLTAIMNLIAYAIIIISGVIWYKITRIVNTKVSNGDWKNGHFIWITVGWVIIVIFAIAFCSFFSNTIYALINPEYWALNELLSKIKY